MQVDVLVPLIDVVCLRRYRPSDQVSQSCLDLQRLFELWREFLAPGLCSPQDTQAGGSAQIVFSEH